MVAAICIEVPFFIGEAVWSTGLTGSLVLKNSITLGQIHTAP